LYYGKLMGPVPHLATKNGISKAVTLTVCEQNMCNSAMFIHCHTEANYNAVRRVIFEGEVSQNLFSTVPFHSTTIYSLLLNVHKKVRT
jgi:hypothetical protein